MFKTCAQAAKTQREKPVQRYPHSPLSPALREAAANVQRILPPITHIVHNSKTHVLHMAYQQINRGITGLIPPFHTTYYYYY